ncbi:hypothetical protein [Methylobacterium sp. Leaf117]|uniref:hypothetical protein n=1 Tax=Methylobacterium sp. Leaf117 TaxID=1736260 RepID=UPI0012E0FDD1|nr:hypothetical protein [Methylobacterium sp. Leaf117]
MPKLKALTGVGMILEKSIIVELFDRHPQDIGNPAQESSRSFIKMGHLNFRGPTCSVGKNIVYVLPTTIDTSFVLPMMIDHVIAASGNDA